MLADLMVLSDTHCMLPVPADYTDNQWRFRLFVQAALEALTCLPFSPGEEVAIVCNDWHSALLPVLLKVRATGRQPQLTAGRKVCLQPWLCRGCA